MDIDDLKAVWRKELIRFKIIRPKFKVGDSVIIKHSGFNFTQKGKVSRVKLNNYSFFLYLVYDLYYQGHELTLNDSKLDKLQRKILGGKNVDKTR